MARTNWPGSTSAWPEHLPDFARMGELRAQDQGRLGLMSIVREAIQLSTSRMGFRIRLGLGTIPLPSEVAER